VHDAFSLHDLLQTPTLHVVPHLALSWQSSVHADPLHVWTIFAWSLPLTEHCSLHVTTHVLVLSHVMLHGPLQTKWHSFASVHVHELSHIWTPPDELLASAPPLDEPPPSPLLDVVLPPDEEVLVPSPIVQS